MNEKEHVVNINGEEDFEKLIIVSSSRQVVAVDFWAPWCVPCCVLGLVLAQAIGRSRARRCWSR